jgi:hypothetical protein
VVVDEVGLLGTRQLNEIMAAQAAQLQRYARALARAARFGVEVAELLAKVARRSLVNRRSEVELWRQLGQRSEPVPSRVDQPQQSRRRGRG